METSETPSHSSKQSRLNSFLFRQVSIAPLVIFRIIFGLMMALGTLRFVLNGWVESMYIQPKFFFTYYGFEWVKPLQGNAMYLLFAIMGVSALMIALGWFYRISSLAFFITFTWIELIDKSNYLNHYYFISIVAFILIWLPAGKYFSIDTRIKPERIITQVPRIFILILQMQLAMVYFFAGVAKLNPDWLFNAMPLRIWLQPHTNLPIIGGFMDKLWIAYLFSWFGALYDLSIPFFLFIKRTRHWAYFFVIVFHIFTSIFFQIGMFPYIMILSTLIFFSEGFHLKLLNYLKHLFRVNNSFIHHVNQEFKLTKSVKRSIIFAAILFISFQAIMPFRYLLYPGNLFWNEEGFRFSWRVMLIEKAGTAFFYVEDQSNGNKTEVSPAEYLLPHQEKMMSTQPDMILQFAHYLGDIYNKKGHANIAVSVESFVSLNNSGSRRFVNPNANLLLEKESLKHYKWIVPFENQ